MPTKRHSAEQIVRKLRRLKWSWRKAGRSRCLPQASDHRAHLLSVAAGVRGAEGQPGQKAQAAEKENARLKKLVAEKELDLSILKEVAEETSEPSSTARGGGDVRGRLGVSERRACRVLKQPRTTQRYMLREPGDEQMLTERIVI